MHSMSSVTDSIKLAMCNKICKEYNYENSDVSKQ